MNRLSPPVLVPKSPDRLPDQLQRVRRWAPWLIAVAAASVALSFVVLAALGQMAWGVAQLLGGIVLVITSATVWAVNAVLRSASAAVVALLDEAADSRRQVDAQLQLRRTVADITARLQQAAGPAELAQALLSALAEPLQAHQSLCCVWDEQSTLLQAAARYGGQGDSAQAVLTRRPRLGNLIEECGRQRRWLVLRDPGPDYLLVGSGLGEMAPAAIVLFPIEHAGRLFAVLELATVAPFTDDQLALLQALAPVFAVNLDLLQRAQRTEDLLEDARMAEENHRLILGAVGEGIWGVDARGLTTFVNPAALRLLGYGEAEVQGREMHALIHHHRLDGAPWAAADSPVLQTLGDGQTRQVDDGALWHQDGTPVPVSYRTTGILKGGRIVGAVMVFRERAE